MKTLFAAALSAVSASAAFASGPIAPPPPPEVFTVTPPSYDWSGFYAGIGVGRNSGDMFDIGGPYSVEGNSTFAFGGYRHDMGRVVVGAELQTTLSTNAHQSAFPTWVFDRFTDLRASVGVEVGRVLPYLAAGYTWSEFTPAGPSQRYNGWNAAIGADVMVSNRVFVGLEYSRRWLESTSTPGWTGDIDTVQLRAGFRF